MKLHRLQRFFATLALLLCCLHCGGTETGNPETSGFVILSRASSLAGTICSNLVRCYPTLNLETCNTELLKVSNIDSEIGLTPGVYASLQAVIESELADRLQANALAASACQSAVTTLNCSDPKMTAAFNPADPGNFNTVFNILSTQPGSCPNFF